MVVASAYGNKHVARRVRNTAERTYVKGVAVFCGQRAVAEPTTNNQQQLIVH